MSNFSSFVDNYILLLAARYRAPLDGEAEVLDEAGDAAWQQVARALQHALHGPLTAEERREMRLVDASFFTAPIVRQRALYLQWHYAEKANQKRRERQASRPTPSKGFDITRDSIKTDVEAIYAVVRAQLPSTVALAGDELDSEEEQEEAVDENKIQRSHANAHKVVEPVELPAYLQTTAAEQQRDAAFGLARDAFLTTIQRLQAEFYQTHRRWVDVSPDILDSPTGTTRARPVEATPPSNKKPSLQEERERLELLMALNNGGTRAPSAAKENARDSYKTDRQAADAWRAGSGQNPREVVAAVREQLMRATNAAGSNSAAKPVRPSAMTNEEIELYYTAQTTPNHNHGRPASGVTSVTVSAAKTATTTAAARAPPPKDTTPPVGRNRRWQIMEYTETNDKDEDSSSSSSEEDDE